MALSKGASELLAQDIRQIDAALAQLETQASTIATNKEALLYKRQLLLDGIQGTTEADMFGLTSLPAPPAATPLAAETDTPDGEGPQLATTGFRASIRGVLKDASKGMRPREVYNELVKRGVTYLGKSDPIIRTSAEMWRMQKNGQVRKRGPLYYAQEQSH